MPRRKAGLVDDLLTLASKLPWWISVVLAIVLYFWLHSVAASNVATVVKPGNISTLVGQTVFKTFATIGQYLLPFVFLLGAAISGYGRHKRQSLHTQVASDPSRDALDQMSWQDFEILVGESFLQQGYTVTETGGGGADGGIDLILRRESEIFLVQCKQWKAYKVGVSTVRELYGVMAAKGATGGYVVTSGNFTDEARAFVAGRNIELLDGKRLHALIGTTTQRGNTPAKPVAVAPVYTAACPQCGSVMVKRTATRGTRSGNNFLGCSRYPACKGTRAV